MDNNKFWEQYKAKCLENGLEVGTRERFETTLQEPQAFSVDMLVAKEGEEICMAEINPIKKARGRPKKEAISAEDVRFLKKVYPAEDDGLCPLPEVDSSCYPKEAVDLEVVIPLLKEPQEKMVSMSKAVFHEIIIMAYERGVMQAQMHLGTLITEADLPVILDDILGENHVQSVA